MSRGICGRETVHEIDGLIGVGDSAGWFLNRAGWISSELVGLSGGLVGVSGWPGCRFDLMDSATNAGVKRPPRLEEFRCGVALNRMPVGLSFRMCCEATRILEMEFLILNPGC